MRGLRMRWLVAAALSAAWLFPACASATISADADCNAHLKLTHHYTVQQLQQALATMPTIESEYTDCSDVIQRQLAAELAGKIRPGSGGGSGGSFLPGWLIVVLIVVILGGAGATVAARRRRGDGDAPDDDAPDDG